MINRLFRGDLGHGIWAGVKDKVMGITELTYSHCKKICGLFLSFDELMQKAMLGYYRLGVNRQMFPVPFAFF